MPDMNTSATNTASSVRTLEIQKVSDLEFAKLQAFLWAKAWLLRIYISLQAFFLVPILAAFFYAIGAITLGKVILGGGWFVLTCWWIATWVIIFLGVKAGEKSTALLAAIPGFILSLIGVDKQVAEVKGISHETSQKITDTIGSSLAWLSIILLLCYLLPFENNPWYMLVFFGLFFLGAFIVIGWTKKSPRLVKWALTTTVSFIALYIVMFVTMPKIMPEANEAYFGSDCVVGEIKPNGELCKEGDKVGGVFNGADRLTKSSLDLFIRGMETTSDYFDEVSHQKNESQTQIQANEINNASQELSEEDRRLLRVFEEL